MSLIIEDGSIVSGAESFISAVDADAYFAKRNAPAAWSAATIEQKEAALLYGTVYLNSAYSYIGFRASSAQELAWPRADAQTDDGIYYASNKIPEVLRQALCEVALTQLNGTNLYPVQSSDARVLKKKIGPIAFEYESGVDPKPVLSVADTLLSGLYVSKAGKSSQVKMLRG